MATLTLELTVHQPSQQNTECLQLFNAQEVEQVRAFHKSMWGYYQPTELVSLPQLAAWLGVRGIYVKDESTRFGLKSFAALGDSYAVCSYLAADFALPLNFDDIKNANLGAREPGLTFAAAGYNHGRGVAWTAKNLGLNAIAYLPKDADPEQVKNIKAEGAQVQNDCANNPGTVDILAKDATMLKIMQGYTTMVSEALEKIPLLPTHVFVQSGAGSLAGAVQAMVRNIYGTKAPAITVLSAAEENPEEVNTLSREILREYSTFTLTCHREVAALGMRLWGNPLAGDRPIVSGPVGAIGGGVIGLLNKYHNIKTDLGITKDSVLLLFNTEGDISPDYYRKVVWGGELPCNYGGWDNV